MKIFRNNEEINIDNKNIKDYLTGKYIKWSDKCPVYYSFIHSVDVNNDFILLDMDEIYYSQEFSFYDFNKNIKRKIPIEGIESYFENHGYNVEISDKETFIELLKKQYQKYNMNTSENNKSYLDLLQEDKNII